MPSIGGRSCIDPKLCTTSAPVFTLFCGGFGVSTRLLSWPGYFTGRHQHWLCLYFCFLIKIFTASFFFEVAFLSLQAVSPPPCFLFGFECFLVAPSASASCLQKFLVYVAQEAVALGGGWLTIELITNKPHKHKHTHNEAKTMTHHKTHTKRFVYSSIILPSNCTNILGYVTNSFKSPHNTCWCAGRSREK